MRAYETLLLSALRPPIPWQTEDNAVAEGEIETLYVRRGAACLAAVLRDRATATAAAAAAAVTSHVPVHAWPSLCRTREREGTERFHVRDETYIHLDTLS